jgi:DNA topoisomerase-1
VRDLVPKTGAVDPDDNFRMKYELIERNSKHVDAIARAVKDADTSCSRPTRTAKARRSPGTCRRSSSRARRSRTRRCKRVVFYEITEGAVNERCATRARSRWTW